MQNCYILLCRIATFFTGYAETLRSDLHMICQNATFFTVYAELLRVYEEAPVMHSPQDVQDTELQLSCPQRIGEGATLH
jgi:hypothetical protein